MNGKELSLFSVLLALACLLGEGQVGAYPDTAEEDIIVDAPWKTTRDYLPVLFFFAEFNRSSNREARLRSISLYNYDQARGEVGERIFVNRVGGTDVNNCPSGPGEPDISWMTADGRWRPGLGPEPQPERLIPNMFHFVVRVPRHCIGVGGRIGQPGQHYVVGRVEWSLRDRSESHDWQNRETAKVMEVFVDPQPLPKFQPNDRYYDAHVHTIAEQTAWDVHKTNASRKAFGGPLVMLMEAAYVLGHTETQLIDENWADFRDEIITTDHNTFYSRDHGHEHHYDAGNPPASGPTRSTDGHEGEFQWYRDTFGSLAGEEVTLSTPGLPRNQRFGAHYLVYDGPHFEGPWHGGKFDPLPHVGWGTGAENPNYIIDVMERMAEEGGFGYAAHPYSDTFFWGQYLDWALGLPDAIRTGSAETKILDPTRQEFSFKGIQAWNGKKDRVAAKNQRNDNKHFGSAVFDELNPFTPSGSNDFRNQRFRPDRDWKAGVCKALKNYRRHVASGLNFSFTEGPNARFVRKVYATAGTDAHGDFNFETSLNSTAEAEIDDDEMVSFLAGGTGTMNANAFGRVRSYVMTENKGPRLTPAQQAIAAYQEGNIVLSDGPICTMSLDADCRMSATGAGKDWVDNPTTCAWRDRDGYIGGGGAFDGHGTAILAEDGAHSVLRAQWKGRIDRTWATSSSIGRVEGRGPRGTPWNMDLELERISFAQRSLRDVPRTVKPLLAEEHRAGVAFAYPGPDLVRIFRTSGTLEPYAFFLKGDLHRDRENRSSRFGEGNCILGTGHNNVNIAGREFDDGTCITNPIWVVPAKIEVETPSGCPFAPETVSVTVRIGATIATRAGSHPPDTHPTVLLRQLDSAGAATGTALPLRIAQIGYERSRRGGYLIRQGMLVATNAEQIACPDETWNTRAHGPQIGKYSYAAIVTNIHDYNHNRLNDIGTSFTVGAATHVEGNRPDCERFPQLCTHDGGGLQPER